MKRTRTLLLILALGAVLRIALLGSVPNGLYADEASNGYDAFSIAHTLRDRTGAFLPLFTRATGDYREAVYSYWAAPFVGLGGLNETATRLPAAIAGTATIAAVAWLAFEIFGMEVALMAALFLAISPWHVFLSRTGFRVIFEVLWVTVGTAALLRGLERPRWLLASGAAFSLAAWTYSAARVFVPLYVAVLAATYARDLWRDRGRSVAAAVVFCVTVVLLGSFWITAHGMSRAGEVGFSFDPVHLLKNYGSYFSLDYLFVHGDPNPRHSMRGAGMLHAFEVVTVAIGVLFLLHTPGRRKRALIVWLLLYPVPAMLTAPAHGLRSAVGAPLFAILSGLGARRLIEMPGLRRKLVQALLGGAIVLSTGVFAARYFLHQGRAQAPWQGGAGSVIRSAIATGEPTILVSDFYGARELVLFYSAEPPEAFQRHLRNDPDGSETIGPFRFEKPADIFRSGVGRLAILEKWELRDIGHGAGDVLAKDGEYRLVRVRQEAPAAPTPGP